MGLKSDRLERWDGRWTMGGDRLAFCPPPLSSPIPVVVDLALVLVTPGVPMHSIR